MVLTINLGGETNKLLSIEQMVVFLDETLVGRYNIQTIKRWQKV